MKEIFDFIDSTHINTLDALQLKCMIEDVRSKAIDEFAKKICEKYTEEESKGNYKQYCANIKQNISDIAEQLKTNTKR